MFGDFELHRITRTVSSKAQSEVEESAQRQSKRLDIYRM